MDEIIFRGSQKLENLQIQLSLAAQQSKVLFQQYSERGSELATEVWHSPRIVQVQDLAKEFISWLTELVDRGKDAVLSVADPRNFVQQVIRLLRNESMLCKQTHIVVTSRGTAAHIVKMIRQRLTSST